MDILLEIQKYAKLSSNSLDLFGTDSDDLTSIDCFIEAHPILHGLSSFISFLRKYSLFGIYKGSMTVGVYGYNMLIELDEPPIKNNDFLGFAVFIKDFQSDYSVSSTFCFDLSGRRKQGIYRVSYEYMNNKRLSSDSEYHYFCDSFEEFVNKLLDWVERDVDQEEFMRLS